MNKSNEKTYSKSTLSNMNCDPKYGSNWIKFDKQNISKNEDVYVLHATGDADLQGRKYIALPKKTIITPDIKKKFNIM